MMILPLTSAVSGDCAATDRANAANAKTAARRKPAAARHADRFLIVFLLVAERAVARIERSEIRGRSILMAALSPGFAGAQPGLRNGRACPVANAASPAGSPGNALPRQTTCRSGRTRMRS